MGNMDLYSSVFFLSWGRCLGFLMILPLALNISCSWKMKVVLSFVFALAISPGENVLIPQSQWEWLEQIGLEFSKGLFLGSLIYLFFGALELSSHWNGQAFGYPAFMVEGQNSLLEVLKLFSLAMFFKLNIHHLFFFTLSLSYQIIPINGFSLSTVKSFLWIPGIFFSMAFLLSLPFFLFSCLSIFISLCWQKIGKTQDRSLFQMTRLCSFFICLYLAIPWLGNVLEKYFFWVSLSLMEGFIS